MKPRERLVATLRHEEPDRIPIDLGSTGTTGIHAKAYYDLRRYLGLAEKPVRVMDIGQQLAEVDKDVLDLFHVDVISINRVLEPCAPYPYIWRYRTRKGSVVEISDKEWKVWIHRDGTPVEIPKNIDIVEEEEGYVAYIKEDIIGKMPKNGYYFWGLDRWRER
jgi:uroporphyrinogen decarboxylase